LIRIAREACFSLALFCDLSLRGGGYGIVIAKRLS
jgi:hypothetical protein